METYSAYNAFSTRHLGSNQDEQAIMLSLIGCDSMQSLVKETVPARILKSADLDIVPAESENELLDTMRKFADMNNSARPLIGQGYYGTRLPNVILRNIMENPGWYTAYTPYQAEIAQGRLEMLINYQTLVCELTGMEFSNASLLDEATAAAEAMNLMFSSRKNKKANVVLVHSSIYKQTLSVLKTRAEHIDIKVEVGNPEEFDLDRKDVFGAIISYPAANGAIKDYTEFVTKAHSNKIQVSFCADPLALIALKSPGSMGADVVVGSMQRYGVSMGFGGPHAGYIAVKKSAVRKLPGRLIGTSKDSQGNDAYRMTLQTREQHIRREKATSNICTAQVLLAVLATAYAIYHGPQGLKIIANNVNSLTKKLAAGLLQSGFKLSSTEFFDTIEVITTDADAILVKAREAGFYFHKSENGLCISLDEISDSAEVLKVLAVFDAKFSSISEISENDTLGVPAELTRQEEILKFEAFNSYHSEHEMLRYLKKLENKDLSLTHSMIALGSCTMKLNATAEMIPVTWPEFANMHPLMPLEDAKGTMAMIKELEKDLCEITGFAAVSLQPNSGAQGEYAGLLAIREYHIAQGQADRNIMLIPASAHGTNPASAAMAGMECVTIKCDEDGHTDVEDLKKQLEIHKDDLAGIMITYPSTHGVYEDEVMDICEWIHNAGGMVYMDGANMNAQVGLTSPGLIGADVCHLNLHKTFAIPHGGGGPGVGPIGVVECLAPFLPSVTLENPEGAAGPVSAAPYGSAGVLPISYAYVRMMGPKGLREATQLAILNANYMMTRLEEHYPVLYKGTEGRCAHEFILNCNAFKKTANIQVGDIAKRLIDYGFHAPTVSFPVTGTLMIEPTESESLAELDRFVDALIAIRSEIAKIESGEWSQDNNPLINAPHTAAMVMEDEWKHTYSRTTAAFPLEWIKEHKFWPTVGRVDDAYGDRNLFCSCS